MNGSTTSVGETVKSTARQQRSKSPALIVLLSTETFCNVLRPSSISTVAARDFFDADFASPDDDANAIGSTPADSAPALLALFSISFSAAFTSASSGRRCNTVSNSKIADDNCPVCIYACAMRLEVLTTSCSRPSLEYASLRISNDWQSFGCDCTMTSN